MPHSGGRGSQKDDAAPPAARLGGPAREKEEGTRRADRIVGKEVVNRKLQIYLMRRAEADAVADLVEPGAPPPAFKLVFDRSGRSQYKVRCAFDSEQAAVGYGFDETSSLFTLEGRPRTAKRPKTRTSSRRCRRVSELTDDESCIRPATAMAATLRASLSSSLGTPPPSRPRSALSRRRAATPRRGRRRRPAGVARLARLGGGPRRRGRAAAARALRGARGRRGPPSKEGRGVRHRGQRRRVPQAARAAGAVVGGLRPRGVGFDLGAALQRWKRPRDGRRGGPRIGPPAF